MGTGGQARGPARRALSMQRMGWRRRSPYRCRCPKMAGCVAAACAAILWLSGSAWATEYPTRPVTLTLAFAPGGPSDVLARVLARKMEQILEIGRAHV